MLKALLGALVMGLMLGGALPLLQAWLPSDHLVAKAAVVGVLIALGSGVYLLVLLLLRVQELSLLGTLLRRLWPGRVR